MAEFSIYVSVGGVVGLIILICLCIRKCCCRPKETQAVPYQPGGVSYITTVTAVDYSLNSMNQTTPQMTNERSSDFESSNLNKRPDNSDFSSSDQPPPYSSLPNEQPYFSEASIAPERDGSFSPNPISITSDRVENPSSVVDLTTPHTLENSSR